LSDINSYGKSDIDVRYMLLHIKLRKEEWCPDNIQFNVSFYQDKCDAVEQSVHLIRDHMIDNSNEPDEYDPPYKTKELLYDSKPMWIPNSSSGDADGDFYQVVELKVGKVIYVNGLCSNINEESW
jgi:hypothetical protein